MNKRWAMGAAVLAVMAGLYFLFAEPGGGEKSAVSVPAMEFSDSEIHEMQDGQVVWKLKAGHVALGADKNTAQLTDIEGYFKNEDMELQIQAERGEAKRAEKTLYLEGNIEGRTADGAVLHAENLTYDGKTGRLSSSSRFTAEKDGKILTADSFIADRVLQRIEARGNARLAEKGDAQ